MPVRTYLGQGLKFPPEVDSFGRIALENDAELIKQSLAILFSEPVGTELMREQYGSQVRLAMFQPNDAIVLGLLDYFIVDAISKWERRIKIADIRYDQPIDKPETINCTIFFIIKQSSEIDSFVFPFYRELKN